MPGQELAGLMPSLAEMLASSACLEIFDRIVSAGLPARFAAVSGLVLAGLAVGAFSYHPTFDLSSAGILASAESQTALKTLEKGLPPGATDPTDVFLHASSGRPLSTAQLAVYGAGLKTLDGVAAVAPPKLSADKATADYTVTALPGISRHHRRRSRRHNRAAKAEERGGRGSVVTAASAARSPMEARDPAIRHAAFPSRPWLVYQTACLPPLSMRSSSTPNVRPMRGRSGRALSEIPVTAPRRSVRALSTVEPSTHKEDLRWIRRSNGEQELRERTLTRSCAPEGGRNGGSDDVP